MRLLTFKRILTLTFSETVLVKSKCRNSMKMLNIIKLRRQFIDVVFKQTRLLCNSPKTVPDHQNLDLVGLSTNASKSIITEKYKLVTIISLNRPHKRNALNKLMLRDLSEAISQFENDDTSTVGVLCGVGGNFSVGYDLDELNACVKNETEIVENISLPQFKPKKPMICAISGFCKSLGFELALMCDIRFVEENVTFAFANRKLGLPLINGGPQRVAQLIGLSRALDITLTGREISAKEACDIGLASGITANGTSLGRALSLAVHLATFPQATLKYDKSLLYASSAIENKAQSDIENIKFTPEILNDIVNGIEDQQTYAGAGAPKTTRCLKLENMPDWEQDEYLREIEYYRNNKK